MQFKVTITKPEGNRITTTSFSLRIVKRYAKDCAKPNDRVVIEEIRGYNSDGYYETSILEDYIKKTK
tara:strand:- start:233 stop:433 length:201 start_codon:yes stop_codon:yes gene_type:complete